jgi:hypothetical protein
MMKKWLFIGVLFLLLSGAGGYAVYSKVRGIRNNNPGNIKRSGDKWQGLSAEQTDPIFFQFVSATYGIRAIMRILATYYRTHGIDTVRGLISRWSATDQAAYISLVSRAIDRGPDESIDVLALRIPIAKAIVKMENGIDPYSAGTYADALALAGA